MSSFAPPLEARAQGGAASVPRLGPALPAHPADWVERVADRHFGIAFGLTVAAIILSRVIDPSRSAQVGIAAAAVAIFGLPHGACDYLVGRALFAPRFHRHWPFVFGIVYLSLSVSVLVGWWIAPSVALVSFLVVATLHFGYGDTDFSPTLLENTRAAGWGAALEALGRGAIVTAIPVIAHPRATAGLFDVLVAGSTSFQLEAARVPLGLALILIVGILFASHALGWHQGSALHRRALTEMVALCVLFCATPPLIAFVVYFCGWHSFRHSLRLASSLDPTAPRAATRAFIRKAWPMTIGAVAIGLAAYGFASKIGSADDALLRVVFIGLSALTVPHIVFSQLASRTGLPPRFGASQTAARAPTRSAPCHRISRPL